MSTDAMSLPPFSQWCSRAISNLQNCSTDQLIHLTSDDNELQQYMESLPEMRDLQQRHQDLYTEVQLLAQTNLEKEPALEEKKSCFVSACDTLRQVKGVYDNDKAQLELYAQSLSPEHNQRALNDLAIGTEEETEVMAQRFLDGKFDTEKFVDEFITRRSKSHVLRIKSEKMADLLASDGHRAEMMVAYGEPPTLPVAYAGPSSLPGHDYCRH